MLGRILPVAMVVAALACAGSFAQPRLNGDQPKAKTEAKSDAKHETKGDEAQFEIRMWTTP
jgi:hypothetical protein